MPGTHSTSARPATRSISAAWIPSSPFSWYFLDDDFERLYRSEEPAHRMVTWASVFTLLIACMGVFGLAAFSTEQRPAKSAFAKCSALPSPAYIVMQDWLDGFAYRAEIGPELLLLPGLAAVVIAFVTVYFQSVRAASADPVKTLRFDG